MVQNGRWHGAGPLVGLSEEEAQRYLEELNSTTSVAEVLNVLDWASHSGDQAVQSGPSKKRRQRRKSSLQRSSLNAASGPLSRSSHIGGPSSNVSVTPTNLDGASMLQSTMAPEVYGHITLDGPSVGDQNAMLDVMHHW